MNSKCEALCPFCDSSNIGIASDDEQETTCYGKCFDCGARGPSACDNETIVARWNRRPPVPTPRAQMVTDAMMDAAWIAFNKFSAKVVPLRYRMRAAIEAALSTPVVPDETDMERARTVGHAEEPELDLSAIVTDEAIWEGLEASVDGGANVGAWLPSTLASTIMRAALEAAAPLLLAELRRLRD